jgi:branched-chain amino acid transport system permease protein
MTAPSNALAARTAGAIRLAGSGAGLALLVALAIAAPLVLYPIFLSTLLCFALFACGFNLMFGYANMLSFGHAAFFGWAAYTAGYLLASAGWPTGLAVLAGALAGGAIGLVIGFIAIRREGIYFAMITLALAQMTYFIADQSPFTGGENGLQGVPRGHLFGLDLSNDLVLYYVVLGVFVLAYAAIARIVYSPFGQILAAIKENEPRVRSLGYETRHFKLLMFTLSATFAGLAGAMKCVVLGFATLTDVHWATSGLALLMTLVGGMGTLIGPVVGAVIMITIDNYIGAAGHLLAGLTGLDVFNQLGRSATIVTGLIFILCVLALRGGIVMNIQAFVQRHTRPANPPARD